MDQTLNYRVSIAEQSFDVQPGQTILDAALISSINFPHSCQVGACSSCKCQLVSGEIRQLVDFAYVLDDEDLERGMILACQSAPKSDLTIKLPLD
jgi:3-phenylpropionate/trans-cinnamate dioxygenase ferredoxin reductase subunit